MDHLFGLDWKELFVPQLSLLEIFVRGTVVYFALLVLLRVIPKWQAGPGSVASMLFVVIFGGLAADAIRGKAETVTDPLLMVMTVMLWVLVVDKLSQHFPLFRRFAEDSPTCLIRDGRVLYEKLEHESMSLEDLKEELRRQGIDDIGRVYQAFLEPDGSVSVLERKGRLPRSAGKTAPDDED